MLLNTKRYFLLGNEEDFPYFCSIQYSIFIFIYYVKIRLMRKKLFLFAFAALSLGQTGMAQTLTSAETLRPEAQGTEKNVPKAQMPAKADTPADSVGYWVDAISYNDASGVFAINGGEQMSYRANLVFDGNKVTIAHLFDTSDWYGVDTYYDITGTYDAAKKTITVKTPSYEEWAGAEHYTLYADWTYHGDPCFIALLSGDFDTTPNENGNYGLNMTDSLVFDVDDNLNTLTPRTGFGLWAFKEDDGSSVGSLVFYTKNSTLTKMPEGASLAVIPDTIAFNGASVTVGATIKREYTLVNKGLSDATITASVNAKNMQVAVPKTISAGSKVTAFVIFSPKEVGAYTGNAVIYGNNGTTSTQLNFKGTVSEAPDFSQVVKAGSEDIVFSLGDNFPFVVTDTITKFPVAVSTNKGGSSQSKLYASFEVPAGKMGIFSWKGIKEGSYANGAIITMNDDSVIFNDGYAYGMEYSSWKDDLSNLLVLKEGSYKFEFCNDTQSDWTNTGDVKLRTYLYDFNLQTENVSAHSAILKSEELDFGSHYFNNLSVRDTLTATLVNIGTEPLKVTAVEGEGAFGAVVPQAEVPTAGELPVSIVYEAKGVGDYAGSVTIKTNAGDFVVDCTARNEAIPVDYQPIVKNGSFSFNTSKPYPFTVEGNKAYNSTAHMDNNNKDSYLEASFEVPEGKVGQLSWTATNYSLDFFTFMEQSFLTTGTRITIDGGSMKEFAGNNSDASSSNWTADELKMPAGRHTVRFYYQKSDSNPKYADKVEISYLALDLTTGIETPEANVQPTRTNIYNVGGQAQNKLQRGVNIVKTTYADGHVDVKKVIVR